MVDAKNEYVYKTISDFLLQYGINLNKTYFELITFEPTSNKSISIRQMPFAIEVTCCVALVLMLASLISTLKSQIAAIFIDMLVILIPIFISIVVYVQACPLYVQIILKCLPITPFITFLNSIMFNGIILWRYVFIFIVQIIGYYFLNLVILKRRIKE